MSNSINPYISNSIATAANTEEHNKFLRAFNKEQEFKAKVTAFEEALQSVENAEVQDETYNTCPVSHKFADGLFIREWESPPNQIVVSEIHKKSNPLFLMEGDVTLLTEAGAERITPPWYTITPAGHKRILYTHTKTKFVNVTRSDHVDLETLREKMTYGSYSEVVKDFPEIEQIANFIKALEK
tara:strand:- start:2878 stop:3429 length:552 start_codon:yes stop_codon:yes gene_type:complete